jgi:MFS family permease
MSRVRYAYVTAAVIDVLNAAFILCFPYIALTLNAGTAGTAANFIGAASYALWCWVFSHTRLFREHRHTIAAGCAVVALAAVLLGGFPSVSMLLVAPAVFSLGNALIFPAMQAWFTEGMDEPRLVRAMGGYSFAWVSGYLVGPLAAGWILNHTPGTPPAELAHRIALLLNASAAILLLIGASFLPDMFTRRWDATPSSGDAPVHLHRVPPRTITCFMHLTWASIFGAMYATGLVRFVFTELAKAEGFSSRSVGAVNAAMYASLLILVGILRTRTSWLFRFRWIAAVQLAAIPAIGLFAFGNRMHHFLVGAALLGLLQGFIQFSSSAYSLMLEKTRDRFIAVNEAMLGGGGFFAGFSGWFLAGHLSARAGFAWGIAVMALLLTAEAAIYLRWRTKHLGPVAPHTAEEKPIPL